MKKIRSFFVDNSLSLAMISLFIVFWVGQMLAGRSFENETRALHGLAPMGYGRYLQTGDFLQGMFSNWQAAILQLGSLILFGVRLRQRGAPHSKSEGMSGTSERKESNKERDDPGDKGQSWWYRNSLSLAFFGLFLAVFVLHLLSGQASYNSTRAYSHQAPLKLGAFFISPKFWFSTLQTWEAEYMAIALYVLLSIFLRQQGSPESKPVEAANNDTGDPND